MIDLNWLNVNLLGVLAGNVKDAMTGLRGAGFWVAAAGVEAQALSGSVNQISPR